MDRRASDDPETPVPERKRSWLSIARQLWRDVVPAIALGLAAIAVLGQQGTVEDLEAEADSRTDGQCTIFEGQHLDDVDALQDAYTYFERITPEDYDDPTFKYGVGQLPSIEERAYIDRAPPYCDLQDEAGREVGLPEPDPVVPERPPALNRLPGLPPQPKKP